jgi:hypothetical protein
MGACYRSSPDLIVVKSPDAVFVDRPLSYLEHEVEEIKKTVNQEDSNTNKGHAEHVE